ncbi:MAG: FAD-binding oxidoreductase [Hyphomicrobiales bacterium]
MSSPLFNPTLSRRKLLGATLAAGAGVAMGSMVPGAGRAVAQDAMSDDVANRAYNQRFLKVPATRLAPTTPDAVHTAMQDVIGQGAPFTIQSSGHCFAGLSQTTGTLIDLRALNSVAVNEATQTVTVGPGTTIGQVNQATRPFGLALPAGYCQTVALGGHASGGGAGVLGRSYGYACDNMLAARLVTADGALLDVDANSHSDLFWALRGGGAASFGVVVGYTFALHRPGAVTQLEAGVRLSVEQAALWLAIYQDVVEATSGAVSFNIYLTNVDGARVGLRVRLVANGAEAEARDALATINARAGLAFDPTTDQTGAFHDTADRMWSPDYYGGASAQYRSDFLGRHMEPQNWYQSLRIMADNRRLGLSFSLEALGGAMDAMAPIDTAFVHRRAARQLVQYKAIINTELPSTPRLTALAHLQETLRAFTTGGAFFNYPETDRPNWQLAYWGQNFERLQQVKRAYDPGNVFRHALSIPV